MAAGTTTEILMQFMPASGLAIEAECATIINSNDKLAGLTGSGMADAFAPRRYFLVDTFKFGVELSDGESGGRNKALQGLADLAAGKRVAPEVHAAIQKHLSSVQAPVAGRAGSASPGSAASGSAGGQSFAKWRSATDDSWRKTDGKQTYNAKIAEFSFTRRIDKSSVTLFDYCCKQKSFAYAAVIKRKSAPVPDSDLPQNQSYLRLDFQDVVVSSVKWSDDDVVEETCTFHAKKMRTQFWSEKFDIASQTDGVLAFLNGATWVNQVSDSETPQK